MESTLAYLSRGWSVLPLERGSKLPATKIIRATRATSSWSTYKYQHASADEVAAWHELEPAHNVGVICGETSGNLAVVDVDTDMIPVDVTIPATATVRTGRGRQFYSTSTDSLATQRFEWGELRGEGSYVVAPDSIHPNGRRYEWEHGPDEGVASLSEFELPLSSRACAVLSTPSIPILLTCLSKLSLDSVVQAPLFAAALGINDFRGIGKPFICLLHPEANPSATLYPCRDSGDVLYHDFHEVGRADEWLTLPKLRARVAGWHAPLNKPTYRTWSLCLDVEAGIREPLPIPAPELPLETPDDLRKLWQSFLFLFACRWHDDHGDPAPYSHRFATAWSGLSKATVEKYWPELRRLGLAVYAGRDARGTSLWLPGEGVGPLKVTK
jgi:hypothetical protein